MFAVLVRQFRIPCSRRAPSFHTGLRRCPKARHALASQAGALGLCRGPKRRRFRPNRCRTSDIGALLHKLFSRYGASGGHAAHLDPSQYGFCSSRSCGKDTVSRSNTACFRCALALVFVLVGSVRRTACDALVFIKSVHLSNGRDTRRIGTRFRMACTRALADTLVPIKYGLEDGYSRHRYPSQYGCSNYSHDTRRASSRSMLRVSVMASH